MCHDERKLWVHLVVVHCGMSKLNELDMKCTRESCEVLNSVLWQMLGRVDPPVCVATVSARFPSNHSREMYAWAGSTRKITCNSLGVPTPTIDWMIGQRVLRNNGTYQIYKEGATSHLQVSTPDIPPAFFSRVTHFCPEFQSGDTD